MPEMNDSTLDELRIRVRDSVKRSKGQLKSSRFDTSDVIQEAMLQIWSDIQKSQLSPLVFPQPLLHKISKGHTAKMRRFHSAEKRSFRKETGQAQTHEFVDSEQSVDRAIEKEESKMLKAAVGKLDPVSRFIVYSRFFAGASFVSISKDLEQNESWVRRHYLKAIKSLRMEIEKQAENS